MGHNRLEKVKRRTVRDNDLLATQTGLDAIEPTTTLDTLDDDRRDRDFDRDRDRGPGRDRDTDRDRDDRRLERRRDRDQTDTPDDIATDTPDDAAPPTDTPAGLGDPSKTPFSNFESVEDVLARLMGRDSPLMQKAAAQGKQFANRRGLLNSSLAAQASQSALLDQIVPIASQTSDQGFRRGLQESEQVFEGSESQKKRDLELDIVKREEALQREKIASDETISAADRGLRKTIAADTISANDRRGAEAMLNNAYRDYESSLATIMSNPDIPATERNKLLTNAKNMLTAKIDYATELYGTVFDWPDNPFEGVILTSTASTGSSNINISGTLSLAQVMMNKANDSDPGGRSGPDVSGGGDGALGSIDSSRARGTGPF